MKISFAALCFLMCLAACSFGQQVDKLDPQYQREVYNYLQVLDKWQKEGGSYTVSVCTNVVKRETVVFNPMKTSYRHSIKLPHDVRSYVSKRKLQFLGEMCDRYFYDDTRSFLSTLLVLSGAGNNDAPISLPRVMTPIVSKDPSMWNKTRDSYLAMLVGRMQDTNRRELVLHKFIDARPDQPGMFNKRDRAYAAYVNAIEKFTSEGNTKCLSELPHDEPGIDEWLFLLLFKRNIDLNTWYEPEAPPVTTYKTLIAFEAWARPNAPANANFAGIIAGVVILDGYGFNHATGDYVLNDIGKNGVSFIVEFPNARTAFFLKTIMDGGNQQLVQKMMGLYGTTEAWAKLFDALPPEAENLPQLPRNQKHVP